jgi:hypothetical protein
MLGRDTVRETAFLITAAAVIEPQVVRLVLLMLKSLMLFGVH